MSKNNLFILFALLLTLFILFGEGNKKKINWFPSYYYKHKIPFGTYVFYHLAQKNLNTHIKTKEYSPYLVFNSGDSINGAYLLYNSRLDLGETNLNSLLEWVKKGNNLYLFSKNIDKVLQDTLHIKIKSFIDINSDSILPINFVNKALKISDTLVYERPLFAYSVIEIDSTSLANPPLILGVIKDSLTNFARFKYGKGKIYLHTTPLVLTNYFILNHNNYTYAEGLYSYLNKEENLYWDTHYQNGAGNQGIFKVLLNTPAFLWAYRLLIIGIVLFLFFEGKRKQRAIPIMNPPVNESLNFVQTIAAMFINKKEHKEMAEKRIRLFMDWLKNTLYLDTTMPQDELINEIEKRIKLDRKEIEKAFIKIKELQNKEKITAKEVLELETLINKIQDGI